MGHPNRDVENTPKLYSGQMIQSRPCRPGLSLAQFQNYAQHGIFQNCSHMFILSYPFIIITRPKLAYSRQGQAGRIVGPVFSSSKYILGRF